MNDIKYITVLQASDGGYVRKHASEEDAQQYVNYQMGKGASKYQGAYYDDYGRSMFIVPLEAYLDDAEYAGFPLDIESIEYPDYEDES